MYMQFIVGANTAPYFFEKGSFTSQPFWPTKNLSEMFYKLFV